MSPSTCNRRGISLVESVIAILILSIGLLGLLSMQPSAWRTTTRTDHLGRAAMLLNRELMARELTIMNPCNAVATGAVTQTLQASGASTAQAGDIAFNVVTTTTSLATGVWRVTVQVSWPPLNATGITESIVVTRQEGFRFGCL